MNQRQEEPKRSQEGTKEENITNERDKPERLESPGQIVANHVSWEALDVLGRLSMVIDGAAGPERCSHFPLTISSYLGGGSLYDGAEVSSPLLSIMCPVTSS